MNFGIAQKNMYPLSPASVPIIDAICNLIQVLCKWSVHMHCFSSAVLNSLSRHLPRAAIVCMTKCENGRSCNSDNRTINPTNDQSMCGLLLHASAISSCKSTSRNVTLYYDVMDTQPALRVRWPNRVKGCVQAANESMTQLSCPARFFGWAWIWPSRSYSLKTKAWA